MEEGRGVQDYDCALICILTQTSTGEVRRDVGGVYITTRAVRSFRRVVREHREKPIVADEPDSLVDGSNNWQGGKKVPAV